MKTLKFNLKRRMSGKAIRALKRQEEFNKTPYRRFNNKYNNSYRRNKPIGKKYSTKLYELEAKYDIVKGPIYRDYYNTIKPRKTQKKALKVYYNIFPFAHPDIVAKKNSEEKKRQWEAKCFKLKPE